MLPRTYFFPLGRGGLGIVLAPNPRVQGCSAGDLECVEQTGLHLDLWFLTWIWTLGPREVAALYVLVPRPDTAHSCRRITVREKSRALQTLGSPSLRPCGDRHAPCHWVAP